MKLSSIQMYALAILGAALLTFGCAQTFLVSKNCKTYFFGSDEEVFHHMLCETGDFRHVLADTGFPDDLKEKLYSSQCIDRSYEKTKADYLSLTPEQKKQLKYSFWRQGYQINVKPVDNFQFNYLYTSGTEFCPANRAW